MDAGQVWKLQQAVTAAGLAGMAEGDLLRLFCEGLRDGGVPLGRANAVVDTLHPVHEGRAFKWRRDETNMPLVIEYGRTNVAGEAQDKWRQSTFYHLFSTGQSQLRCRLASDPNTDFTVYDELRAEGQTDYVVMAHRFSAESAVGEFDCIYTSWMTDHAEGFTDEQVAVLADLAPTLALAIKSTSLARIAETLMETYLGRDAGRRVLSGRIERGVAEQIGAVLWFSDLRHFTQVTDQVEPELIIPFLNDYADAAISSIHEAGGDVLKLVGDGVLAIFQGSARAEACRCALKAERLFRSRLDALNRERGAAGLPVTDAYLGLHIGKVFYGNIGSQERLDFTVVGPAVNEVSRIAALCRSVEQDVLVSTAFRDAVAPEGRGAFISVGRYALRGVARPQELFTLDPDLRG
ncbi:MAG TPA: adenylate/guanylate cyclase domain-containing protein [Microvirga sp.]|jgi:adenylate cyclase|nr:adenylate/guanylate cyclase domain-containing protein [Microvirga sp.]